MGSMESQNKEVILITEDSLQSSLLKEILEKKLNMVVHLLTPKELDERTTSYSSIKAILVDYSVVEEDFYSSYLNFIDENFSEVQEVLINCQNNISIEELCIWRSLTGIFYLSDDISTLELGIDRILSGDMWFSRKISQEFISTLRQHSKPISKNVSTKLTKREQQIITLLSLGNSNQQIARKLFVRENTVKTHLHNIFKKIDVKNRVQALIWAKEHLSPTSSTI
ncbi:TPA: helix-turn-helix transcriptional regulator [Vibrio vulnificus]|nr:helix-turn-helix transcriptional regulator [Vibrio vulnificus]EGQ7700306.1 helix-turn-helix transcriptional regulator [Vibrio vulnificus]EGQ7957953.1 helix-turn-helix transcriptional regulator [Vibrio vulnificus]EGQ7988171.1 helix-turn-helix transcriptional regulator [Vibrio vulnificus]EGQ9236840.1 helix-turn-helix transcriptional regulator [Vibrio vulnificus]